MITINPKEITTPALQMILQTAISPRPIALASTIDKEGNINLSPFSFFNMFSTNPPILIFSPSSRVRDNTTKHTLQNVKEVKEVVIGTVNYDMVQQVSLSSTEYDKETNEFIKAGLTMKDAHLIKPKLICKSFYTRVFLGWAFVRSPARCALWVARHVRQDMIRLRSKGHRAVAPENYRTR